MSIVRFAAGSVAVVIFAMVNFAIGGTRRVDATLEGIGRWA
jgi:hypothetical protein